MIYVIFTFLVKRGSHQKFHRCRLARPIEGTGTAQTLYRCFTGACPLHADDLGQ
jgi:hypothetical protein